MGRHDLINKIKNGELFGYSCLSQYLIIVKSIFQHRSIHKFTWNCKNRRKKNYINHNAISQRYTCSLLDMGAKISSDYNLLFETDRIQLSVNWWKIANLKEKQTNTIKILCANQIPIIIHTRCHGRSQRTSISKNFTLTFLVSVY